VTEVKQKLIAEGLFALADDGKTSLIVTHCKSCGDYFFPKTFTCYNPKCKDKEVENVFLSRIGKVTTHTVQYYPPPPPYNPGEDFQPILFVAVEFPEGINVIGTVEDCDPKDLKIGMEMELITGVLYTNKDQEQIVSWKFKPV
jgi:uncharacterized OB-fold protein